MGFPSPTRVPALALGAACLLLAVGCGAGSGPTARGARTLTAGPRAPRSSPGPARPVAARRPAPPALLVSAPSAAGPRWTAVARVRGHPAAWLAERGGVTLMRFDQALTTLALHIGALEPGGSGWRYGDRIGPSEVHRVIAGFNGGFKLSYGGVGFMSFGRVAVPLSGGLASIVTYRDGATQIAAWGAGVPARGRPIASVRQNLRLMVDRGQPSGNLESCALSCWGATLGGGVAVARSALGIDGRDRLVWAAGESLTPGQLAQALVAAGVQRAVELDINPFWVAGYLYEHRPGGPVAVPAVPGQHGIEGELLGPDNRDFFTVSAR